MKLYKMLPAVVDNTILSNVSKCSAFGTFSHLLGLAPNSNDDLTCGAAFAAGVEAALSSLYIERTNLKEAMDAAQNAATEVYENSPPINGKKTLEACKAALIHYMVVKFPIDEDPLIVRLSDGKLGIELNFLYKTNYTHPIFNTPIFYSVRVDRLVQHRGHYWMLDEKTASQRTSDLNARYQLGTQFLGYKYVIEKELGIPIKGVIIRETTVGNQQIHCDEVSIPISNKLLPVFEEWVDNATNNLISIYENMPKASRNDQTIQKYAGMDGIATGQCYSYFKPCAFSEICKVNSPVPYNTGNFYNGTVTQKLWVPTIRTNVPFQTIFAENPEFTDEVIDSLEIYNSENF